MIPQDLALVDHQTPLGLAPPAVDPCDDGLTRYAHVITN
jgi:hypothetical protein